MLRSNEVCRGVVCVGFLLPLAGVLSGCGAGSVAGPGPVQLSLAGKLQGGQQGVVGATIQLYTVGATGNGSAATPMLTDVVKTTAGGFFTLHGDYQCGVSSTGQAIAGGSNQVYIVATGGNPGLAANTNNKALAMMAVLGPCSGLASQTSVFIDEVTTVAAAWALAPFATSVTNIGASATNATGIQNAFANALLLANTVTGMAATPAANLTIETGKLYSLANSLAPCVNSDGTTGCQPLFAASSVNGTQPTDTMGAALNIVKHPGQNVVAVYQAANAQAPFPAAQTQPNDWTMSMTITGGGLTMPTGLAIDQSSNVWVAGQASPLSAFGPQGAPLSANGFGQGSITQAYDLAVDTLGDIWVTNYNATYRGAGAVTKFMGSTSGSMGTVVTGTSGNPGFYDTSISYPFGISADTNGNIFIANNGTGTATVYDSNGNYVNNIGGRTYSLPQAIAADNNHGFWLSDSSQTVSHYGADGSLEGYPSCCAQSYGLATDATGNVWVADYLGGANSSGAYAEVAANGTVLLTGLTGGGVNHPAMVVLDAAQNVWMTNLRAGTITEVAGNAGSTPAGTALSPTTGVNGTGGFGLDAALSSPFGIAPDSAGNLWVSNEGKNAITMFFGLATPTATPVQPVPVAP